ncbi:MAG: hypothetical protein ACI857_000344, partial [Arenicella sp.]
MDWNKDNKLNFKEKLNTPLALETPNTLSLWNLY